MAQASALHQAMALADAPLLAGAMRAQPLPGDILFLIELAAGDEAALARAAGITGLSAARVREAAVLFIQHVVFAPQADHYRVLAVTADAPQAKIREHVGWLMKWLHPDRVKNEWEAVFAQRVVAAWNALKTPDKRAAYDRALPVRPSAAPARGGKRRPLVRAPRALPLIARHQAWGRPKARRTPAAAYVLGGAVIAVVVFAPQWNTPSPASDEAPVVAESGAF